MDNHLHVVKICVEALNTIIGHSSCWADGLMALAGLGSNPGFVDNSLPFPTVKEFSKSVYN